MKHYILSYFILAFVGSVISCDPNILLFTQSGDYNYNDYWTAALDILGYPYTVVQGIELTDDDFIGIDVFIDGTYTCGDWGGSTPSAVNNYLSSGKSAYMQLEHCDFNICNQIKLNVINQFLNDATLSGGGCVAGNNADISTSVSESSSCILSVPNNIAGKSITVAYGNDMNGLIDADSSLIFADGNAISGVYSGTETTVDGLRLILDTDINHDYDGEDSDIFRNFIDFLANGCEIECDDIPSNSECIDSYEISNYDRIFGTTSCSSSKTCDIPSCSSSIGGSPVLFYKYTSLYDYEEIIIDTCLSNSDFDTYLSVYIGDCDNLQCIGFDNDSCDGHDDGDDDDYNFNKSKVILSGTDNGVAAGTNIIIAVHGTDNEDGIFTLRIQEKEELPNTCNSNGPYIQCPSSIQIPSTTMCDNQQCAITPLFDMGSCSDLCGCSIQQINGPEPGDEISERNTITLQATNNNDISNECSFNIIVQNSCNTNGPIVDGCEDLIYLETENTCATNDGNECVILDTNGMGAICHDSCGCSIYQSSGPVSGDKLEPGTYEIVFSGLNDLGMESSSSSSCISTIIVNSRS